MIIRALKKLVKKHKTIPAPEFLEDDPWFGPATLSEKQIEMKEARKQLEDLYKLKDNKESTSHSKQYCKRFKT